eukprot:CAMPEP_0176487756 /NCGR_PEP_ID=MMETSP0200_2-20121128/6317_1 /TAXON_ID=947934 /ORGANISM="Chaetoceros sp., Strain GSL56" /LENGTH=573 /DNA_ID=CAMNT_0017884637 /DNA_START=111 /DNA_END=1830 /DNA_ORIENTATION=+
MNRKVLSKLCKFSSTTTRSSQDKDKIQSRIAIGTNRLSTPQPHGTFPSVIATAIQNNINTFETTLDKEEEMRRGMTDAIMFLDDSDGSSPGEKFHFREKSLKVIGKISYRTCTNIECGDADGNDDKSSSQRLQGDVLQEQNHARGDKSNINNHAAQTTTTIYHNLSPWFIRETISKSPLVEMYQNLAPVDLIYCAHNPEAQGTEMIMKDAPLEDVREHVKETLIRAFITFEQLVGEQKIGSYGVCSNGLGLSSSHPMHLSWEDVLAASAEAARRVHGDVLGGGVADGEGAGNEHVNHFSTMQLPVNLLEIHGLKVANRVKDYLASPHAKDIAGMPLPNQVQIHSTRPLTCYPDRGTGTGYPFKLVDYLIPTAEDGSGKGWSHDFRGIPAFYTTVLNETMAHFDATPLLEIKEEEGRELTMEERETLDGCKLLQSMIHDLDANLSSGHLRSFAAYEEDLYTKVIPMMHGTFEELDANSAAVLQRFFQAHGTAVRYSIAKTTRQLLKQGGDGVQRYDIPDDMTMQEFAIRFLLEQQCDGEYAKGQQQCDGEYAKEPSIDRIIVGCPKAEHVIEAV